MRRARPDRQRRDTRSESRIQIESMLSGRDSSARASCCTGLTVKSLNAAVLVLESPPPSFYPLSRDRRDVSSSRVARKNPRSNAPVRCRERERERMAVNQAARSRNNRHDQPRISFRKSDIRQGAYWRSDWRIFPIPRFPARESGESAPLWPTLLHKVSRARLNYASMTAPNFVSACTNN